MMSFNKDSSNPIEADAIIIDETSMVDIQLLSYLLEAVTLGTRLIFVGDKDQLPSVGPGNVLSDLIKSEIGKTITLENIHRQSEDSMISENAHLINEGIIPSIDNQSDFMLVNKNAEQTALDTIVDLVSERIPRVFNYDSLNDIQVICPLKKGLLGTISLNKELQQKLNPPDSFKKERNFGTITFREGDKVMQIKNNYNLSWENPLTNASGKGIYNGDIGIIKHMDKDTFLIRFQDGRECEYKYENLDEIIHAYAVTVHKSQGSEFKVVLMPLVTGYPQFLNRKLLYTAVTRAKEKLILIGKGKSFDFMIDNDIEDDRNTRLDEQINYYKNLNTFF